MNSDLILRLRERARIRRQIQTRKSVQNGEPDRIADLLDEAADALEREWCKRHKDQFGKAYRMQNMADTLTVENRRRVGIKP